MENLENNDILLGIEMELDFEDGRDIIPNEIKDLIDYIIGSSHHQPIEFLQLPDIEVEEIEEFFDSYRNILINSFKNNAINIWGHPFLRMFEHMGDRYWKEYLYPIYVDCLDVCENKQIAIELTSSYYRKCQKYPITFKILDEMYALAMERKDIYFVTSCDSHNIDDLGELTVAIEYVNKFGISDNRILEIEKKY